jgi:hypothetical protein
MGMYIYFTFVVQFCASEIPSALQYRKDFLFCVFFTRVNDGCVLCKSSFSYCFCLLFRTVMSSFSYFFVFFFVLFCLLFRTVIGLLFRTVIVTIVT